MLESGDRVVVGLSGGADSCTLLSTLCSLKNVLKIEIVAAHLNHGIRGDEALRDMNFSRKFAQGYSLPFVEKTVSVPEYVSKNKLSSEEAGRKLRYEFFYEVCKQYNCNKIAVAHNLNDRAETILLNIIRGSASKGFEGIKPTNGCIIRPLIETSRCDIEEYALQKRISYVTDSTNSEDIYARNIIRNTVLPQMKKINSAALENIIRCSEIISSESSFIDSVLTDSNIIKEYDDMVVIDREAFIKCHDTLKKRSIIKALYLLIGNTQNISYKQIKTLIESISTGNKYSFGNGAYAIVTSDKIEFSKKPYEEIDYSYSIKVPSVLKINETGVEYRFEFVPKHIKKDNSVCIAFDYDDENLIVRTRNDGDKFHPSGLNGTKKIKNFFIDNKIPVYDRAVYPLVEKNGKILAVIPLRVSEEARVTNKTNKILMITKVGGTYDNK